MFGTPTFGSSTSSIGSKVPLTLGLGTLQNPMKDLEVASPPDDSVSAIKFSPKASFFVASSWSNDVSKLKYSFCANSSCSVYCCKVTWLASYFICCIIGVACSIYCSMWILVPLFASYRCWALLFHVVLLINLHVLRQSCFAFHCTTTLVNLA